MHIDDVVLQDFTELKEGTLYSLILCRAIGIERRNGLPLQTSNVAKRKVEFSLQRRVIRRRNLKTRQSPAAETSSEPLSCQLQARELVRLFLV